jgi:hypothetical protein
MKKEEKNITWRFGKSERTVELTTKGAFGCQGDFLHNCAFGCRGDFLHNCASEMGLMRVVNGPWTMKTEHMSNRLVVS